MMRLLLPCILILTVSCTTLPEIIIPDRPVNEIIETCSRPFLKEKYRMLHSIRAEIPRGGTTPLLGVVVIDPSSEIIDAVLMTIEGLVIFNANYNKKIKINRALPPFDSYKFAEGMIKDIKQIFLRPGETPAYAGLGNNRSMICRYQTNNITTDIAFIENRGWTLYQYNEDLKIIKTIHYSNEKSSAQHKKITLKSMKKNGYKLYLELIKAEKLKQVN